jgi:hypothetical protein
MALRHVIMALALIPSAAYADCENEARKARENILASGPFHYRSRQWNRNFDRLMVGMIEPNKAEHIIEGTQNGEQLRERIYIDKQGWENDGLGWLPPLGAVWSHNQVTRRETRTYVKSIRITPPSFASPLPAQNTSSAGRF